MNALLRRSLRAVICVGALALGVAHAAGAPAGVPANALKDAARQTSLDPTHNVATGLAKEAMKTATDMASQFAAKGMQTMQAGQRTAAAAAKASAAKKPAAKKAPAPSAGKSVAKPAAKKATARRAPRKSAG